MRVWRWLCRYQARRLRLKSTPRTLDWKPERSLECHQWSVVFFSVAGTAAELIVSSCLNQSVQFQRSAKEISIFLAVNFIPVLSSSLTVFFCAVRIHLTLKQSAASPTVKRHQREIFRVLLFLVSAFVYLFIYSFIYLFFKTSDSVPNKWKMVEKYDNNSDKLLSKLNDQAKLRNNKEKAKKLTLVLWSLFAWFRRKIFGI